MWSLASPLPQIERKSHETQKVVEEKNARLWGQPAAEKSRNNNCSSVSLVNRLSEQRLTGTVPQVWLDSV